MYIRARGSPIEGPVVGFHDIILGEFNLLTLALTLKGKPNSLKDYNNLNKVNTDNILSFINYITIGK